MKLICLWVIKNILVFQELKFVQLKIIIFDILKSDICKAVELFISLSIINDSHKIEVSKSWDNFDESFIYETL